MSKAKHSAEWKIVLVNKYLRGEDSYTALAEAYSIDRRTLRDWVQKYQEQGEYGFSCGGGNRHYSKEFKVKCVESVLCGEGSVDDIVAKYNISDKRVLRSWIMKYNANMELKITNRNGRVMWRKHRGCTRISGCLRKKTLWIAGIVRSREDGYW